MDKLRKTSNIATSPINANIIALIDSIDQKIINIIKIDKETILEETKEFWGVVKLFIKYKQKTDPKYNADITDILSDTTMYKECLLFFFLELGLGEKIKIKKNNSNKKKLDRLIKDFEARYGFNTKNITKIYDLIYKNIYKPLGYKKQDTVVKKEMLGFLKAYHMMKEAFSSKNRKTLNNKGKIERAFEHSKETMLILLKELPQPNRTRIIAGLLHDSAEDIEGYSYELLENLFGPEIAKIVKHLTKKDWRIFLSDREKIEVSKYERGKTKQDLKNLSKQNQNYRKLVKKGKIARNYEYFGKLGELFKNKDYDTLNVKFADRIHNLRTMNGLPTETIVRKIIETENYFLEVALREKNRINNLANKKEIMKGKKHAYDLLIYEIEKLKENTEILNLYNEERNLYSFS